jgi:hypothetical protein
MISFLVMVFGAQEEQWQISYAIVIKIYIYIYIYFAIKLSESASKLTWHLISTPSHITKNI